MELELQWVLLMTVKTVIHSFCVVIFLNINDVIQSELCTGPFSACFIKHNSSVKVTVRYWILKYSKSNNLIIY